MIQRFIKFDKSDGEYFAGEEIVYKFDISRSLNDNSVIDMENAQAKICIRQCFKELEVKLNDGISINKINNTSIKLTVSDEDSSKFEAGLYFFDVKIKIDGHYRIIRTEDFRIEPSAFNLNNRTAKVGIDELKEYIDERLAELNSTSVEEAFILFAKGLGIDPADLEDPDYNIVDFVNNALTEFSEGIGINNIEFNEALLYKEPSDYINHVFTDISNGMDINDITFDENIGTDIEEGMNYAFNEVKEGINNN